MVKIAKVGLIIFIVLGVSIALWPYGTDEPPLPPTIPATSVDVVDFYDQVTDLSRAFKKDLDYLAVNNLYENIVAIKNLLDPGYRYDLTKKAKAGDADAQYRLTFLGGSPEDFLIAKDQYTPQMLYGEVYECSALHWLNTAAKQKHTPALAYMSMIFHSGGTMNVADRRLATFYFWTWSQLRGFDIKNYTGGPTQPLSEEEFTAWSEEFRTWDISSAVSTEPKSCPGCTENCVTIVENSTSLSDERLEGSDQ